MLLPESRRTLSESTAFDWRTAARGVLAAVGSLRLTVFLLSLGLVLILFVSLQQTRHDIYQLKQLHFGSALVYIPFQELIIPAWFPNTQSVGGGLMMPSGASILLAMLVNLVCAHVSRFRIQVGGRRLLIGLVVLAAGAVFTLVVIVNGNRPGFQESPLVPWLTQWKILQAGLGLAGCAGVVGAFLASGKTRKVFSGITGALFMAVFVLLMWLGDASYIGDDAMRIVWRLAQGLLASVFCYIGALLVFRRKAGIVIVHSGLLLLMMGELYTTWSAVEQRVFFYEGQTTGHTFSVDHSELAFSTPTGDGNEKVVTIDGRALRPGSVVDDPRLPFRVRTLAWYTNSAIENARPDDPVIPDATGIAQFLRASERAPVTAADPDGMNLASAYVELVDRENDKSLGVFLVSQQLWRVDAYDLDRIEASGREWRVGLRFRQYYKPYSVHLESTTRSDYLGTTIPQSYSSTFRIIDPVHNVDEIKKVSMNQPLRYNNETFYQAGHDTDSQGRTFSILQVVQNTGWMIPYVCCAFVGFGLFMHLLGTFVRFVERVSAGWQLHPWDALSWALVIGSIVVFGGWAWRELRPERIEYEAMNLSEFGKIPVVSGGRIQPLDSLARTTLRETRKRETVPKTADYGERQSEVPAIRWLADWVFGEPGADEYLVFKIDDPEIQSALNLVRRKRNMYSYAEIEESREEFARMVSEASAVAKRDESQLTAFQKRILKLSEQFRSVGNLRLALASPDQYGFDDATAALAASAQMETATGIARAVPGNNPDNWSVLAPLKTRYWLADMARKHELNTPEALASHLVEGEPTERLRELLFREELMIELARFGGDEVRDTDVEKLEQMVDRLINDADTEATAAVERFRERLAPDIERSLKERLPRFAGQVAGEIATTLPLDTNGRFDWSRLDDPPPLVELDRLWASRDADGFNRAVETHLDSVGDSQAMRKSSGKVAAEFFYNQAAPFYVATAVYIAATVLTLLSWLGLAGAEFSPAVDSAAHASRRAAFWLMFLAFVVHSFGLILRIYISGRAPVTSLHSSSIFIGWGCVVLGMIVERLAGYSFGTMLGSVTGFVTLLISFSLATDVDTFSVLVAVLDTQFWLSTHVVCVTLGYASTFVAGALGMMWIVLSVLTPVHVPKVREMLVRLIYGVASFALLLSFVGTVLGGLWADDSWGRFWGWDPKENGALMIVLANALLLHARWAGLVRDRGIAMIAVFASMVTIWSWFAVNELGIGLHQYGLTEGRMAWVGGAWLAHLAVICFALVPRGWWLSTLASDWRNR